MNVCPTCTMYILPCLTNAGLKKRNLAGLNSLLCLFLISINRGAQRSVKLERQSHQQPHSLKPQRLRSLIYQNQKGFFTLCK